MNAALVRLALRRALPLPLLVAYAAFVGLAAAKSWIPASAGDEGQAALRADAFLRQGVWIVFVLIAIPALVIRAADVGNLWRRRDADWLGSGAVGRLAILGNAWTGLFLGACILVAGTVLVAAGATGSNPTPLRFERTLAHEPLVLHPGEERKRIPIEALPGGTRLLVEATVAPGSGPAATIRATLGGSSATARVFGRHTFELQADAEGPMELTFERLGAGAVFVLPSDSIDVVVPAAATQLASLELGWRMLLAVGVWCAVALALGAWMRTALAAGVTGCLALVTQRWLAAAELIPGASLLRAWNLVGRDLLPPYVTWPAFLVALLLVVGSLGVARLGLDRGRSLLRW